MGARLSHDKPTKGPFRPPPNRANRFDGLAPGEYIANMAPSIVDALGKHNLSSDANEYHAKSVAKPFWCAANQPPPEYNKETATAEQSLFRKYHKDCCGTAATTKRKLNRDLKYHLPKFTVRRTPHWSREGNRIETHWSPNDIYQLIRAAHEDLAAVSEQRRRDIKAWREAGCIGDVPERTKFPVAGARDGVK